MTMLASRPWEFHSLCLFSLGRMFWERTFSCWSLLPLGVIASSGAPIVMLDVGAAPCGLRGLRKGVKNPSEKTQEKLKDLNTGKKKKKRASGLQRLRNWPRQEVGRVLFSVRSWELSWKVLWWVCVEKRGFNQAINICFFEVLWPTINVTGRHIKSRFLTWWVWVRWGHVKSLSSVGRCLFDSISVCV